MDFGQIILIKLVRLARLIVLYVLVLIMLTAQNVLQDLIYICNLDHHMDH